jgi:Exo70 exocyst complex subunit
LIRVNKGLSVPDPDVRGVVVGEIKRVVMPLYSRFYDKYSSFIAVLKLDILVLILQRILQSISVGTRINSTASSHDSLKEEPLLDLKFNLILSIIISTWSFSGFINCIIESGRVQAYFISAIKVL